MKPPSSVTIDDLTVAIETARDKVMADEVRSLVKFGIPRVMAHQMVAARYQQKVVVEEGEAVEGEAAPWPDIS